MPGIKAGFPAKRAADLLTRHGFERVRDTDRIHA